MAAITLGSPCLAEVDLVIVRGATSCFRFEWTRGDPPEPVDLENASALCQVRARSDAASVELDLTPYVSFEAGGVVEIDAPPEATSTLSSGRHVWDVMVRESNGAVSRLAAGKVTCVDPVSEDD